jgi:hypothetical protein
LFAAVAPGEQRPDSRFPILAKLNFLPNHDSFHFFLAINLLNYFYSVADRRNFNASGKKRVS